MSKEVCDECGVDNYPDPYDHKKTCKHYAPRACVFCGDGTTNENNPAGDAICDECAKQPMVRVNITDEDGDLLERFDVHKLRAGKDRTQIELALDVREYIERKFNVNEV